ncbi:25257_t:CDS:2 [Gigaspora rosea]|nr:25257_t:CDS:2 [Gigaspora rosea]
MDADFIKAIIEGVAFTTTQNTDIPHQAPSFVEFKRQSVRLLAKSMS